MTESSISAGITQNIKDDILIIVGGSFTPDSLGPEVYEAVLKRVHSRTKEYLDVFESLFLGSNLDVVTQSHLYLPTFLDLLASQEPERVRTIAEQLLKQYDAVLTLYDAATDRATLFQLIPNDTMRLAQRLDQRRAELQGLTG